jgi:hypothetical protein
MWIGDDPLSQIPQFTPDKIKTYKKAIKEHNIANASIDTFCRLTPRQREGLGVFTGE